jgi:hypothetical protein
MKVGPIINAVVEPSNSVAPVPSSACATAVLRAEAATMRSLSFISPPSTRKENATPFQARRE